MAKDSSFAVVPFDGEVAFLTYKPYSKTQTFDLTFFLFVCFRIREYPPIYFRGSDAIIYVVDVTNAESLQFIKDTIAQVFPKIQNLPVGGVLCANKIDDPSKRELSAQVLQVRYLSHIKQIERGL